MTYISVCSPAKLNLALKITGVLPNGYHTVDMLMQAVSLYERVEICKSNGYSLRCPGSKIPKDNSNTATKAAKIFFTETGLLAGADIILHKKVPTRAGLAGGSADAAAVLFGLNELYNTKLTLQKLCNMGASIGSDVPFSLMGGTARVRGIGEELTPLPPLPHCWFVIAMPCGQGNSTPEIYRMFDQHGSDKKINIDFAQRAIEKRSWVELVPHMQNMLEDVAGVEETARIRKVLDSAGAAVSMMTGSGAAVFGVYYSAEAANKAAKTVKLSVSEVFVVSPVANGPYVENFK